jgi:glycosyltransferase involved in cell wall biosynthesis
MAFVPGVSVVMSAHNEERAIRACLESVSEWAGEVIVVDSESTDATAEIARSFGATVVPATNKLMLNVNKNIAIGEARHEWVLLLDPDERVSDELATELVVVAGSQVGFDGMWLPRRDRELGRWLAGSSPQLRFFRNGRALFPCRHIHEMVELDGVASRATAPLLHEPRQSLFEYVHKRNLYSEHRAQFLHEHGARFKLHRLLLRPPLAFAKSYFRHHGWRSGVAGLVVAASAGYGTFLQDAKLWQLGEQDGTTAAESFTIEEPAMRQGARGG